jgi:DNA polymerase-3 subunit gamma/tau
VSQTRVLARKWRPKSFSQLTGQDHIVRALTNALEQQRLHHAYLFTGTRGIGKTTIARILAKALNCRTGITSAPCGICSACTEIDEGRFVDLLEVDAASNTQVEKMRELLENALYAPTTARYKIYIIDEVHMLSKSAFNAMLKTLEEPPEHVKFILATTDPQRIPVTVLSRCLQFNLKQIPPALIAAHLKHVLEQEQIGYDAISLQLLARAAQGSLRDALSILDQAIAFGEGKIEEAGVRDMLGAIDQSYLYDLLDGLARKNGSQMLATADAMETHSLSFDAALQDLGSLLHRIALAQIVPAAIAEDMPERERLFALAQTFTAEDIQLFYQIAIHGRGDLSRAPDEYAGFTMTLMRMLAFMPQDFPQTLSPSTSVRDAKVGANGSAGSGRESDAKAKSSLPPIPEKPAARQSVAPEPVSPEPPASIPVAAAVAEQTPVAEIAALPLDTDTALLSGNWIAVLQELKLSGLAKMLAQNSEVKHVGENEIEFCVPQTHKHLLNKDYQDRVQTALRTYLGRQVRLRFSVGVVTGMTPAELENREKQERQSQAITALESDPFVRELMEQFDAKLVVSSIKPIQ